MQGKVFTFDVYEERRCAECGKGFATQNGLCLKCTTKMIQGRPMKSQLGRALQRQFEQSVKARKARDRERESAIAEVIDYAMTNQGRRPCP